MTKNPFDIIHCQHVTEKAMMLNQLQHSKSNRCVAACNAPKYVFVVDKKANKQEIAWAVQEIYKEKQIKVVSVNTLHVKPKKKRMRRGRIGQTVAFKKAIITLEPGDSLE